MFRTEVRPFQRAEIVIGIVYFLLWFDVGPSCLWRSLIGHSKKNCEWLEDCWQRFQTCFTRFSHCGSKGFALVWASLREISRILDGGLSKDKSREERNFEICLRIRVNAILYLFLFSYESKVETHPSSSIKFALVSEQLSVIFSFMGYFIFFFSSWLDFLLLSPPFYFLASRNREKVPTSFSQNCIWNFGFPLKMVLGKCLLSIRPWR